MPIPLLVLYLCFVRLWWMVCIISWDQDSSNQYGIQMLWYAGSFQSHAHCEEAALWRCWWRVSIFVADPSTITVSFFAQFQIECLGCSQSQKWGKRQQSDALASFDSQKPSYTSLVGVLIVESVRQVVCFLFVAKLPEINPESENFPGEDDRILLSIDSQSSTLC